MIKRFCDICDTEITTDTNANQEFKSDASRQYKKVKVEISYVDDLCIYCLLKLYRELDHRPKAQCKCGVVVGEVLK